MNSDSGCFDSCRENCFFGNLKKAGEFLTPVFRLAHFLKSMLMIVDMVTDVKTTIFYYNYGVNPNSFKSIETNDTYMQLNSSSTSSTVEPSSVSTNFLFFYIACGIWALNPAMHAKVIIIWLNHPLENDDWLTIIEEKFELCSSIVQKIRKQF